MAELGTGGWGRNELGLAPSPVHVEREEERRGVRRKEQGAAGDKVRVRGEAGCATVDVRSVEGGCMSESERGGWMRAMCASGCTTFGSEK
jgi:hypothetical protein